MRWLPFLLVAWLMLGLELGLRPALKIGPYPIAPSFVFALAAAVALVGPPGVAYRAVLVLGLCVDLTFDVLRAGGVTRVVGPYALGYLSAAWFIVTTRTLMFRRNALTLGFLTLAGALLMNVVVVALLTLRSFYDPIEWNATEQLGSRLASSLLTGLAAAVLAPILLPLTSVMGLSPSQGRRFTTRRA